MAHLSHRHSGLGIASLAIALLQGFISGLVTIAAVMLTTLEADQTSQVIHVLVGAGLFGGIFIHLIGLGLGIAGTLSGQDRKLLAIVGLVVNASAIAVLLLLLLTGPSYQA